MLGRNVIVVAGLAVLLLLALMAGPFTSETTAIGEDPPEQLLPDLRTLPPRDIEIVLSRPGPKGERRLRFDNRIWNAGHGPVEASPVSEDCDGDGDRRNDRLAVQRIYRDTNDTDIFERGLDTGFDTHNVGCMEFHARHNHWHIEDFATYELYQLQSSGGLGNLVATSTKVSFCMIDTFDQDPSVTMPGEPSEPYYKLCGRDESYGISIGMGDEYQSTLADQWIVVNGVSDGNYCLVSKANPAGLIVESDYSNNLTGVKIAISGNAVSPRNPVDACGP